MGEPQNITESSDRIAVGLLGGCDRVVGELVDVGKGRFTGASYVGVLEDILLPTMRAMAFPELEPSFLVQDNSSIHTANVVKA